MRNNKTETFVPLLPLMLEVRTHSQGQCMMFQASVWRRGLFVITIIVNPGLVFAAENFQLTILTKGSGDPVDQATVAVISTGETFNSDESGLVRLEDIELPSQLKILAIGYQSYTFLFNGSKDPVYLEPFSVEGEGLSATADRIEQKSSKISLQKEELTKTPGTQGDPIKVIQSLPGVVSGGGLGGFIYLRGTNAGDNIYRMNHKPIAYLYHFGGLRSVVHPDLVKDFNIFLSGFPVEHGDNIGGSLDVLLRDPKTDRLHQNYSVGLYESSFLVEGPTPATGANDSAYLAARRSYVDGVFALIEALDVAQFQDISFPVFHDVQANWHRQLPRGSLDIDYFRAGDAFAVYRDKNSAKTDPETAGQFAIERVFDSIGLRWEQQWHQQLKTRLIANYFFDRQKITVGANLLTGEPYFLDRQGNDVRIEPHAEMTWNQHRKTQLGVTGIYSWNPVRAYINQVGTQFSEPGSNNLSNADKFKINTNVRGAYLSPYIQHRERFADANVILGARYSVLRGSGGFAVEEFSPRSTLEYQLWDEKLLLSAHWGRFIKVPSGYYWAPAAGNPTLQAETAEHQSLGAKIQLSPLWQLQTEVYRKPLRDLVVDIPAQNPPDNFLNGGSGMAQGYDILLKREYKNGVLGWMSFSYVSTKRRNDLTNTDFASNSDQPYTLVAVYSQNAPGSWNRWRLGLRVEWHSGAPYTPVVGRSQLLAEDGSPFWVPIYGDRNSKQLPSYFRADLRIDRKFLFNTWSLNAYIDIWNVTVRQNISGYNYGEEYKDFNKPKPVGFPAIPLPFFGIEATL